MVYYCMFYILVVVIVVLVFTLAVIIIMSIDYQYHYYYLLLLLLLLLLLYMYVCMYIYIYISYMHIYIYIYTYIYYITYMYIHVFHPCRFCGTLCKIQVSSFEARPCVVHPRQSLCLRVARLFCQGLLRAELSSRKFQVASYGKASLLTCAGARRRRRELWNAKGRERLMGCISG